MHDVLISYSSKDKAIADAVCNRLESEGIRVWIAPRDIGAGESYPTAIVEGIKNCTIIVMLFTANSNQSQWVPREMERGVHYGKVIIPFKIEDAQQIHEDIALFIQNDCWIDATTSSFETGMEELVRVVKELIDENNDVLNPYSLDKIC